MARNKGFRVPDNDWNEFNKLVNRANYRILKNMEYIQQEGITSESTQRSLLHDFARPSEWHTNNSPLSLSRYFESEREYKQQVSKAKYFSNDETFGKDFTEILNDKHNQYYKNIVQALNKTAIDYGQGVLTESGHLPKEITDRLKDLSYEQITNFFDIADPTEDIEQSSWSYEEFFEGVDRETFIEHTLNRLNYLQELFPTAGQRAFKKAVASGENPMKVLKQLYPDRSRYAYNKMLKNGIPAVVPPKRKYTKRK